jgi:general secretion pathway protein L
MSLLVIQIPPRTRLAAQAADAPAAAAGGSAEGYAYVLSPDGVQAAAAGRAQPALLPKADSVVAVLADADVGWQRITLPKAPAARLRAALGGILEDHLLEDDAALHLALAPGSVAGQPAWVAVADKAWLQREISDLEKQGPTIDRIVPSSWPGDAPHGHFFEAPDAPAEAAPLLAYAYADGAMVLRLRGSLARSLLPRMTAQPTRWTATPPVAAPAERWLGQTVTVQTDAERALQAARSLWNLRQFDLAPTRRGTRALRDAWRRWRSPAWRPVRFGLAALAAVQLVGLNVWAWQQRQAITERQQAQEALLRATFPGVRAVIDAPLQMRRETEVLRAAAGRAGDDDLEALLGAAASAWPEGQGPLQTLRFEPGRLTIGAAGWSEPQVQQFRDRLRLAGLAVEQADGRLTIARAPRPGAPA